MTLEEAKEIIKNLVEYAELDETETEAIEIIFIALENDKNSFKKQVEITQEANSLYEKEKEKNIKLEKEIRENYIPKEKVREKIKSIEAVLGLTTYDETKLNALYELLEE